MKAIWKYVFDLSAGQIQHHEIPEGGVVRHVARQDHLIAMWVEVFPDEPRTHRVFRIVGTGHREIEDWDSYLGTVQMGIFAWHLYEVYQ